MRTDSPRTWNLTMYSPDGGPATEIRGLSQRDAVQALNDLMYGVPVTAPVTAEQHDKAMVAA